MGLCIRPTRSARDILGYLAARVFADLPSELWDSHLWLYGEILPLLSAPVTGYETDRIAMYLADGGAAGVAVGLKGDEGLRVYVHAPALDAAEELVRRCAAEAGRLREVSTVDGALARALGRGAASGSTFSLTEKLWTCGPAAPPPARGAAPARELDARDAQLFDRVTFPDGVRGWPGFRACLDSGLRYFGAFEQGRLVSRAGLCRLSRARSEIIAVCTFREADRRKGYASAASRLALAAALEESAVCTWTARAENEASIRAAHGLGMRSYLTRYDLRLPPADDC